MTEEIKVKTLDELMEKITDIIAPPRKLTLTEAKKLMVSWEHICVHLDELKPLISCSGFKNYQEFTERLLPLHQIIGRMVKNVAEEDKAEVMRFAHERQTALEDSGE